MKNQQQPIQQSCVHHKQPFTYYCESCQEPICRQCTTLGPHNYNLHRINALQEAFKQRVDHIQQDIQHNLLPKRDEILAQVHRIEYRIEEIKYVQSLIERDCRAEDNGITERLNQAVGSKVARLQNEIQSIQQDLDQMNDIGIQYKKISQGDQVEFLLESKQLLDSIEFLIAKPYKKGVDEIADDLPRELTDLRLQLGKLEGQQQIIDILNEIIWKLMNEKKQEEELLSAQLQVEADLEVKEWSKLVDFFKDQLKQQQMVCYFCNTTLDAKSVNKKCKANIQQPQDQLVGFCKENPNDQQLGNAKHYFGHPIDGKFIPVVDSDMVTSKGGQYTRKFPSALIMQTIMSKIKLKMQNMKVPLLDIFVAHDNDKNGLVNEIVFSYILSDSLELLEEEIMSIVQFMDCKEWINYNTLFSLIRSNKAINEMEQELQNKYQVQKTLKKPKTK